MSNVRPWPDFWPKPEENQETLRGWCRACLNGIHLTAYEQACVSRAFLAQPEATASDGARWRFCAQRTAPSTERSPTQIGADIKSALTSTVKASTPSDETVWDICRNIRCDPGHEGECDKCPAVIQTSYGDGQQMCRGMAEAAYRIAVSSLPSSTAAWAEVEKAKADAYEDAARREKQERSRDIGEPKHD